jgi:hypothetical protein
MRSQSLLEPTLLLLLSSAQRPSLSAQSNLLRYVNV